MKQNTEYTPRQVQMFCPYLREIYPSFHECVWFNETVLSHWRNTHKQIDIPSENKDILTEGHCAFFCKGVCCFFCSDYQTNNCNKIYCIKFFRYLIQGEWNPSRRKTVPMSEDIIQRRYYDHVKNQHIKRREENK